MHLTAVVLTHNNEDIIKRCLQSLEFCQEIIVVDDVSCDATVKIAKKIGAVVYKKLLQDDFSAQRNFALNKTNSKWVLFIDSDEVIDNRLKKEIQEVFQISKDYFTGYYIKRKDVFLGKVLRYGETGGTKLIRLAKTNTGKWERKVHEKWEVKGKIGELKNPIYHYPHQNLKAFIRNINHFSYLHAKAVYDEGKRSNFLKIIVWPTGKFFYYFIVERGFLDGMHGFVYAMIMSLHSFLSWSSLWILQRNRKLQM